MSGSTELLALRLALTSTIFVFVLVTALTMRSGLRIPGGVAPRRASRPPGARLILVAPGETGLVPGTEFALAGMMTVGRDAGCSVVLGDSSVSGQHARIERMRDSFRIADLGSTNGTFVDGRRVDGRGVVLRGGERVMVGAVTLRFAG